MTSIRLFLNRKAYEVAETVDSFRLHEYHHVDILLSKARSLSLCEESYNYAMSQT
jgi:hypothetical protein